MIHIDNCINIKLSTKHFIRKYRSLCRNFVLKLNVQKNQQLLNVILLLVDIGGPLNSYIRAIHTSQRPEMLVRQLHYDSRCHMWRADVTQALRDMRVTHRNQDLIDWSIVNEFI